MWVWIPIVLIVQNDQYKGTIPFAELVSVSKVVAGALHDFGKRPVRSVDLVKKINYLQSKSNDSLELQFMNRLKLDYRIGEVQFDRKLHLNFVKVFSKHEDSYSIVCSSGQVRFQKILGHKIRESINVLKDIQ